MRVRLIAAGTRLPDWVNRGYAEYAKRLGRGLRLELVEIPVSRRGADIARAIAAEGEAMRAAIAARDYVVALEAGGRSMTTGSWRAGCRRGSRTAANSPC